MDFKNLTQESLDRVKAMFPEDEKLQALTLQELIEYSHGKDPNGSTAQPAPKPKEAKRVEAFVTDCQWEIGMVVLDCIYVLMGAWALRSHVSNATVEETAKVIAPHLAEIEKIVQRLAEAQSTYDQAKEIFAIGKLIFTAGLLEEIYRAIYNTLTWWDAVLYSVLGLAELTAMFLTDGAATVAEVVAEIALVGWVVSDAAKAIEAC